MSGHEAWPRGMAALEAPTTAPLDDRRQSAAAIVNSEGQILVVEGEFADGVPWVWPQGTVRPLKACGSSSEKLSDSLDGISGVLESTVLMLRERFGLEVGPHVVPVQVMDERHVVDNVQWVLFRCTDVIGDLHASFMSRRCTDVHGRALGVVTWQWMEEVIEQTPSAKRAPLEALYAWAAPVLSVHEAAAKATDFSGLWTRDASRNSNVAESLAVRGLPNEIAAAEANKPYVQHWRRHGTVGSCAWEVTTFDTPQTMNQEVEHPPGAGPKNRVLVYHLGDWTESYRGASTLYGKSSPETGASSASVTGLLVRRTGWMPEPEARPEQQLLEPNVSAALLPPACVAHTTWSSRTEHTAEIVARFLRNGEMIVRRTMVRTPLRAHVDMQPIVCEEIFVRQPGTSDALGAAPTGQSAP